MEEIQRTLEQIAQKIIILRDQPVLLDRDVAELYGVETRDVNKAVRNNPNKFPKGYIFELQNVEHQYLVENFHRFQSSKHSTVMPKAFTEKGLYMLATILKSKRATEATLDIIETYAHVRELQRNLISLNRDNDEKKGASLMERFAELLSGIVMPELRPEESETSLELNFIIGKLKYKVKRTRTHDGPDRIEEEAVPYGGSLMENS